jgi:predicted transcriptional regulator
MSENNAKRFLHAFNRIEKTLRKDLEEGPGTPYKTLIGEAAKLGHRAVSAYQQRLISFSNLRNSIVHEPDSDGGEVIARPRTDIVEEIEQIADNLESPPTIESVTQRKVYTVLGNQLVRDVAQEMKERDFSQTPVITSDGTLRTLLTTNTIARWFAETSWENAQLDGATIEEVLDYREREDGYTVLSPSSTVFDIVETFATGTGDHIPPYAAIVTDDGTDSGTVEGIITPYDLPAAYDRLAPSHR